MKILSLGWGVQSWTLAAMVALGELEPVDYAVHADTTHEASWTYGFAERNTAWLENHGLRVVTVRPDTKNSNAFNQHRGVFIPAFTNSAKGRGQLRRQCTGDWKIAPMRRYFQSVRNGESIELWLGISLDEYQRMKTSDVKYITNHWPLIDKRMTRLDCIKWLRSHDLEIPNRSSCVFCPYHDTQEWRQIMNSPADRESAIQHDNEIRKARPPFDLFIHPSRKPIEQVDLRTPEEKGQMTLWDNECHGICGV